LQVNRKKAWRILGEKLDEYYNGKNSKKHQEIEKLRRQKASKQRKARKKHQHGIEDDHLNEVQQLLNNSEATQLEPTTTTTANKKVAESVCGDKEAKLTGNKRARSKLKETSPIEQQASADLFAKYTIRIKEVLPANNSTTDVKKE
jgi:hypothetical protein